MVKAGNARLEIILRVCDGSQPSDSPGGIARRVQADGKHKDLNTARSEGRDSVSKKVARVELPEKLLEMIIARMPFPSLFKARCLSRSWYFKFPLPWPYSRVRGLSLPFHEQIASVSSRWPALCPTYVSRDGILGLDRGSKEWQSISSFTHLPVDSLEKSFNWWSLPVTSCGPLILICGNSKPDGGEEIYVVTNALTKCWRKLPTPPNSEERWTSLKNPAHERIIPVGINGYRVVLVRKAYVNNHSEKMYMFIYDSRFKSWTVEEMRGLDMGYFYPNSAYLDEKFYFMFQSEPGSSPIQFGAWHGGDNSWTAIPHSLTTHDDVIHAAVLCCGVRVMVVTWLENLETEVGEGFPQLFTPKDSVKIYELDPISLDLEHVDTGPPTRIWGVGVHVDDICAASDADFMYFGQSKPSLPILSFNVHTHEWSCLHPASYSSSTKSCWGNVAFEPGLNPFMEV